MRSCVGAVFLCLATGCAATNDGIWQNCFQLGSPASKVADRLHRAALNGRRFTSFLVGKDEAGYQDALKIARGVAAAVGHSCTSWDSESYATIDLSDAAYSNPQSDCRDLFAQMETHAAGFKKEGGTIVVENVHRLTEVRCLHVFMEPMGNPEMQRRHGGHTYTYSHTNFIFVGMHPTGGLGRTDLNGEPIEGPHLELLYSTHPGFSPQAFISRIQIQAVLPNESAWNENSCRPYAFCGGRHTHKEPHPMFRLIREWGWLVAVVVFVFAKMKARQRTADTAARASQPPPRQAPPPRNLRERSVSVAPGSPTNSPEGKRERRGSADTRTADTFDSSDAAPAAETETVPLRRSTRARTPAPQAASKDTQGKKDR
eukprot:comp12524_c0_seq1/m.7510 comp12524_c0_seq1/g.7510  ORF comp12524_c0_seq1/g.7510 comp12524_c0_seq1/m.7510 type:complete len:372 (-) comp12524_c0_seq1:87-1202(-)